MNYVNRLEIKTFTIPAGQTASDAHDIAGAQIAMIFMPATWTGGVISVHTSYDGVNYQRVDDGAGNDVAIPVRAGVNSPLQPYMFYGARYYRLVSSSPVVAETRIAVSVRPV